MPRIETNGVALEFDEMGPSDGPPILLIMGFGAQMTWWPGEFCEGLAQKGLRVIRFDNRDTGLSQKWDGIVPDIAQVRAQAKRNERPAIPYTLSDMAGDAVALLDGIGVESAHVLGGSMGGMLAQLVAIDHRQRARSLISIFSTTGDRSLPRAAAEATAVLTSRAAGTDRASVIEHELWCRRTIASTGFSFDERREARAVGDAVDRCYYPEGMLRHWAAFITAPARSDALRRIRIPALVMHGSADKLIPCEAGRHTAACLVGSEYVEIPGWGHDMPGGLVPELVERIVAFVTKVEAGLQSNT
ncbi:MAG TPA: alpha/beta hydrolase [Rhizomicrobium sp.]|nr:alpha/beta hydrolase [Rhizomicrobium sp.]